MTAQDWHYGRAGNGIGGSGDAGPATKLDKLEQSYLRLWKLYVFVPDRPRQDLQWAGRQAERILRRRFAGIRNQFHP